MSPAGDDKFDVLTARVNAGQTQRELAAACGVSLTVIQRLESGGTVTPRSAKRVGDHFGVQVLDLIDLPRAA